MDTRRQARTETTRETIYVDGRWIASTGIETIAVIDPTTAQAMGSVPAGSAADVDAAVAAATRAFPGWSEVSASERGRYLVAIADGLERRSGELAELIALEVGMPEDQCAEEQIPVEDFRINAELARSYPFEETVSGARVLN